MTFITSAVTLDFLVANIILLSVVTGFSRALNRPPPSEQQLSTGYRTLFTPTHKTPWRVRDFSALEAESSMCLAK